MVNDDNQFGGWMIIEITIIKWNRRQKVEINRCGKQTMSNFASAVPGLQMLICKSKFMPKVVSLYNI